MQLITNSFNSQFEIRNSQFLAPAARVRFVGPLAMPNPCWMCAKYREGVQVRPKQDLIIESSRLPCRAL